MSRGPGRLQRFIVAELQSSRLPQCVNVLCWKGAEALDGTLRNRSALAGAIAPSFYKAFFRAKSTLVGDGVVETKPRRIKSVEEALVVLPALTRRIDLRGLRQQLLPALFEYGLATPHVRSDCTREEEVLFAAKDDAEPEALEQRYQRWLELRRMLTVYLQHAATTQTHDYVLRLLLKGARYFDEQSFFSGTRGSTRMEPLTAQKLIDAAQHHVPTEILYEYQQLVTQAIPRARSKARDFKDVLFRIADFHQSRKQPGLKPDARQHLLRTHRAAVENLPGHTSKVAWHEEERFSPMLDQLLDRHAFRYVEYLRLASDASAM